MDTVTSRTRSLRSLIERPVQARVPLKIAWIGLHDGDTLSCPETLKNEIRLVLPLVHTEQVKKRERMCRRPRGLAEGSLKLKLLLAVRVDDGNHYWDEWGSL